SVEPPEQNASDRLFLDLVESLPTYEGVSDDELIDLAHDVCDTLDSGVAPEAYPEEQYAKLENGGISIDEWGDGLIPQGAAVGAYCPEHADEVTYCHPWASRAMSCTSCSPSAPRLPTSSQGGCTDERNRRAGDRPGAGRDQRALPHPGI